MILGLAGLLLAGCAPTTGTTALTCTVEASLDATEGAPGDTIVVNGGPFSEPFDTTVRVAGATAEVLSVDRADCAFCDSCIEAADCTECTSCDSCVEACDLCVETTTFVVPDVPAGDTTVILVNRWGSTTPLAFTVLGGDTDTGAPDTDTDPMSDTDTDGPADTDTDAPIDTDTGAPDTDTDPADTDTDTGTADTDPAAFRSRRAPPRGAKSTPAVYRPAAEFLVCPRA